MRLIRPAGIQLGRIGDAALGQGAGGQALVRIGRTGHVADDRCQIEMQGALILRVGQIIGPQTGRLGVGFDQRHLIMATSGQAQIIQGIAVDEEHRGGGTVFRSHVGNRGAVADGQRRSALATELEIGTDHLGLPQELGQCQNDIGGGDSGLRPAGKFHADDFRRAHPGRTAEHHAFGFKTTDPDGNHAERVDVRRVAVGPHAGIRKGHAILHLDHRRHLLQIDLVHDAVARRNHLDIAEGLLGPVDEVEAVFIAPVFDGTVLGESIRIEAAALHRQRVVDDELHRHHRIDLRRIAAHVGDGIAQSRQIDQGRLAEDVMADHTCRKPGEIQITAVVDQLQEEIVPARRLRAANDVFRMHARGVRQGVPCAAADGFDGGTCIEVFKRRARQWLAEIAAHRLPIGTNSRFSGPV